MKGMHKITMNRLRVLKNLGEPFCLHKISDLFNMSEQKAKSFLQNTKHRQSALIVECQRGPCRWNRTNHKHYNYAGQEEMLARRDTKTIKQLSDYIEEQAANARDMSLTIERQQAKIIDLQDQQRNEQTITPEPIKQEIVEPAKHEDDRVELLKSMLIGLIKGI